MNQVKVPLTPIARLTRDAANILMQQTPIEQLSPQASAREARSLVDLYYTMQEVRKRLANQIKALERGVDSGVSHECADFVLAQAETLESNAERFLETYATSHATWPWFAAVHGIGHVLAAGLVARLGTRPVPPTIGHWWRYAGLDPSQKRLKREEVEDLWKEHKGDIEARIRALSKIIGRDPKTVLSDATTDFRTGKPKDLTRGSAIASLCRIPFNQPLKTLLWKCSDQWVKLGNRQDAVYAVMYRERKAREVERNESGGRAELAEQTLRKFPQHAQKAVYRQGKLPDGRLDLMARRATVKIFLSHLHEVWWRIEHNGEAPPKPFSQSIQGHGHHIPAPYLHLYKWEDAA